MTTNQPTNTQPDLAPSATDHPFPQHPFADTPTFLGAYYHRRNRTGLATTSALINKNHATAFGADPIADAKRALNDMDTAADIFENLNPTQTRELLTGLHNEARNTLADAIHQAVHETQPEYSDPCDDPTCHFAELTPGERNARSALHWMATLVEGGAHSDDPAPRVSPQTQQGLRRALDEAIANSPLVDEQYAEFLAATDAAVDAADTPPLIDNRQEEDKDEEDDWDDAPYVAGHHEAARERLADSLHKLAHHLLAADPTQLVQTDVHTPTGPCNVDFCSTENALAYAFHVRQRQYRPHTEPSGPDESTQDDRRPEASEPGAPAHPDGNATDEFGTHMPHYQRGRAWAATVLAAQASTRRCDAHAHLAGADQLLGPLGNLDRSDDLRDFIAGAARQFDADLDYYAGGQN